MNRPIAGLAVAAALTVAGCASAPAATTVNGTETLTATVTGKAAAANLNSSSNAPLTFGSAALSGPVAGTIKPFTLTGSGPQGTATWRSSAGPLTVFHKSSDPASSSDAPPPATWTLNGRTCHFTTEFDYGTFTQDRVSSGGFAATTWHGTYTIRARGNAPLLKGKKSCGFTTTGPAVASGASIVFTAAGPLVKKRV